jgi:multimeric flavodoxin WrbA
MSLRLNCTLKPSPSPSSTERLLSELLDAFREYDAHGEIVRVADLNIKPGVSSDEGSGDDWPELRKRVLACDIRVIGSPIWLDSRRASPGAFWNGWMHFSMNATRCNECQAMGRSALRRWSAMRMALTTLRLRCARPWPKSALQSFGYPGRKAAE